MRFKAIAICTIIILTVVGAYKFGQLVQDARNGYKLTVHDEHQLETPRGPLKLKNVSELIGLGFLETSKQILVFEPSNGTPITIYKSQAGFQEIYPQVENLRIEEGSVLWTDGIFNYRLAMEPLKVDQKCKGSSLPAGTIMGQMNRTTCIARRAKQHSGRTIHCIEVADRPPRFLETLLAATR